MACLSSVRPSAPQYALALEITAKCPMLFCRSNLFRKATGDGRESVTAAIFWLKARARWKETSINEHSGIDGKPIEQVSEIRRIVISAPERATGLLGSPAPPCPLQTPSTAP